MGNEEVRAQLERLQNARHELQRQINFGTITPADPIYRYIDPINRSIMVDPVTAEDGKDYERRNIELWIAGQTDGEPLVSPVTRKPMGPTLTPNAGLKKEIQQVSDVPQEWGAGCCGRPEDGGVRTAKTVKRPAQPPIRQLLGAADAQTAHPNGTSPPHPAQPQHTNDTSRSTGRSGRQKAATRRNMRREDRGTVQGPVRNNNRMECHSRSEGGDVLGHATGPRA